MTVSLDPRIGAELAGYRIESMLGRGGMGVVYRATDLRLKRPVALKLLAPGLAEDAHFRERFLRESELAASLDHSHVIPIYEAGEAEGLLYIAMRYVEGTDLAALLRAEGPLELGRALELVAQVADALDAAHARGLVHRDVKPANVLVAREGGREHCYLSDFGLSRGPAAEPGDADSSRLSGTVDYVAPEQIEHDPADGRADLYSLACVLYECLASAAPFARDRALATLWAHVNDPPPSLCQSRPDLPEAIDAVLVRALAKDPDERYATGEELCEAAREALGLEAPARLTRRALLLAGGGAVALAAAAAVPAILLTRQEPRRVVAPKPILPLAGDAIVRIDPLTGTLTAAVPAAAANGPLAVGEGSVWLGDRTRKVVSRIDSATSTVAEEIDLPDTADPIVLAVGEGALWFLDGSRLFRIWKYDLAGRQASSIDTGDVTIDGLATANSALWTVCTEFLRIDPDTGEIEARIDLGAGQGDLLVGTQGAIWFAGTQESPIASSRGGRLWRVDPETSSIVATIELDEIIVDIAAGEGAVWLLTLEDDLVSRLDPATNEVAAAFRIGRIPEAIAVGEGAVWVASARDGTVTRFDPRTADVKTIEVGGTPTDLAAGAGGVWVAVKAT